MANCLLDETIEHNYLNKNFLALTIFTKTVYRVQQERSYYLNCVQKEDIWDSKNIFRNRVHAAIVEENSKTETLKELIEKVVG